MAIRETDLGQPAKRWYSAREVATMLGITQRQVYNLAEQRTIPAVRLNNSVRIPIRLFEQWLAEREAEAATGNGAKARL